MSFNGFISYSHAADGRLAPAVQRGLHRLAKPWHRRRALWIFRDQTGLSVTPALWTSIQKALDDSEYFVLMASPEAAASPWVNREIEHWVAHRPAGRILPVVTDGDWEWDPHTGDFTTGSTAVPDALRGVFAEEPLYLDLRWARDDQQLDLRHSRFRDAIAQLAAPMHGVSKDDLEGEDVRQHRRVARLRMAAVTSLLVLSGLALLSGALAARNAAHASAAVLQAQAQAREAAAQRDSAARFSEEAKRQQKLASEQEARARDAAGEADRQEQLAARQKGAADAASAEAALQTGNAERAAARARTQEQIAKRQVTLARESAREMHRHEQRAKEQERLAREQERLAAQAAAEAKRQQEYALEQQRLAEQAKADANLHRGNADEQQRIAISRRLLNEARLTIADNPPAALRLGVAARSVNPGAETAAEVAALIGSTRHAGSVTGVSQALHGPGNLLVTADTTGTFSVYDVKDRAHPVRLARAGEPGEDWWDRQPRLNLSRDGKTLVVRTPPATTLWDLTDPSRPVQLATLPQDRTYHIAEFSPDGETLVTGVNTGRADRIYATLWDLTDRRDPVELAQLGGPTAHPVYFFGFSPDGRTIAAGHDRIDLWDITTPREPQLRGAIATSAKTRWMAVSPARPELTVATEDNEVYRYDITDPAARSELPAPPRNGKAGLWSTTYSPDGNQLLTADDSGTVVLYDLDEAPTEVSRFPLRVPYGGMTMSRDGRTVVTADGVTTATLWNTLDFAAPQRTAERPAHQGRGIVSAQSADGRTLTTIGEDGRAVIWDLTRASGPAQRRTVTLATGTSAQVAVSADATTAAVPTITSARERTRITVTDLTGRAPDATIDSGPQAHATALSPDGNLLVVTTKTERQLWNLTDRSRPARTWTAPLPASPDLTAPAVFSPDGHTLALGGTGRVELLGITGPSGPVHRSYLDGSATALAFGNDGNTLAGFDGSTVSLWNVTDRTSPYRYSANSTSGHHVTAMAFGRDNRTLLLGGGNSRVMLWDLANPVRPARLVTLTLTAQRQITGLALSPDGRSLRMLVNRGDEPVPDKMRGTRAAVEVWDLTDLQRLRAAPEKVACTIAGRGLSAAEWNLYIPEIKPRKTC